MNDKILTMALIFLFIMVGINGFLLMASTNLQDEQGRPLNIYHGLDDGGLGSQLQTNTQNISVGASTGISSEEPGQSQGLVLALVTTVFGTDDPVGLFFGNELKKLGIGAQLVLQKFSYLFPLMSPMIDAVIFFIYLLEGLAIAYLFSIIVRAILGRIT